MDARGRARAMRAEGDSFDRIAAALNIGKQWAYKCAGDVERSVRETASTVVRHHSLNGGCSTMSGPLAISMPRITALHGAAQ
jgi:hypothetical protein